MNTLSDAIARNQTRLAEQRRCAAERSAAIFAEAEAKWAAEDARLLAYPVMVWDVDADGNETLRCAATLGECYPDDVACPTDPGCALWQAYKVLRVGLCHSEGGGAAPLTRIYRA